MSGRGGIEDSLLPVAIGVAGSIAAPALAPVLLGETAGATAAGVALTGAGLGGAGAALTGRDPLMGALTGGIGGFTAGGGFSDLFGGAVAPEAFDYASEAYAPMAYQGVGATTPAIAPAQPVLADYYTPVATPVAAPTDLTQGGVDLNDLDFVPRPGPNVAGVNRYMGIDEVGQQGGPSGGGLRLPPATPTATTPVADTTTAAGDYFGRGLQLPGSTPSETMGSIDAASAEARKAMAATPGKGIAGAGKEPSWWSGLSNMQKAGIIGAGGLGAYTLLKKDNERYGAPGTETYTGPLSKFSYDPSRFTPTYATPNVYRPRYAEGGTVEQMSRNNAIGANLNFPQSNVGNTLRFSNPTNTPMPDNVLGSVGAGVDPYTGAPRFAAGGLASTKAFAVGGTTGVYDPRTLNYAVIDDPGYPSNPAMQPAPGMQQPNIVDYIAAQKAQQQAQQEALALQYGNDGGGDGGGDGGAGGGGGGGAGGGCVDPDVLVLMANGGHKKAGEILVGDFVHAPHQDTLEYGNFEVLAADIITQPKLLIKFDDESTIKVSDTHKFLMSDNAWKQMLHIKLGDVVRGYTTDKRIIGMEYIGEGDVVKFNVDQAHTYISDGLVSHNDKKEGGLIHSKYAKGGIASAAPSHMQAIDDYMAGANTEGGMQALMAKAKAGDYNAMIALNKLRKTPNENYAGGGHLGSYSDGGRMLKGPGDGMSDDIPASIAGKQPARLADNEFVVPADVVSHLGNGSSDAGAKKLYAMMDKVRKARTGKKKQAPAIKADKYMPA